MVIIKELGLEAEITVNGSTAAEYPDPEPEDIPYGQTTKACHRYVESVDNAEFAIRVGIIPGNNPVREWTGRSRDHRLLFSVAFDGGHAVRSKTIWQYTTPTAMEGISDHAKGTLRKFRFAPVSTVDDVNKERITRDMHVARDLGLIRICIFRGIWKQKSARKAGSGRSTKLGTDGISLAEKALKGKAISHGTALSAPVRIAPRHSSRWEVDWRDSTASPLAVFYFKYRSKESLQQELIIERPRSPTMESDLVNLSPEEIRRLALERLSQMKDSRKRDASVKDEDDTKVFRSEKRFKYVRIEGGKKAIDLTQDD
ncbi:hypothetical protein KVR01_005894 [Diaporthe batatas]|uniref:uncharacterized protein n=1 Tax=Diaporthe batatas TaxID=748121 RepID=UPI001D03ACC1|nr:uncharacterized protein KVR01_005894 [Diaporthe batatas]KAG8163976.1 hypothetical protein KVR01_005894 [Diaporthe batatas]